MSAQELMEEFSSLPAEAQRQVADFIALLRQHYGIGVSPPTPSSDLAEEPFVGMWSQRDDLSDSSEWVSQIRKAEWREECDVS